MKYIGIDVSKHLLDVYLDGEVRQFKNTSTDILGLLEEIKELAMMQDVCIVAEATGGYEKPLISLCCTHNISTHVAHANKVRAFAKSQGVLAKTDSIDAKIITEYSATMSIQPNDIQLTEVELNIQSLLTRRAQLVLDMNRDKNRLDKISNVFVLNSLSSHIEWLQKEIEKIDSQLDLLSKDSSIAEKHKLLTSVPSIGDLTACQLIANLPELGRLSHKKIAALVGVAPYNRQSGNYDGRRYIQGGRGNLRKALYMSAISSIRWNPDMKAFYDRLTAAGKPAKVAIIAVMRKLLCVLNSIVKRESPWQENAIHA